MKPLFSIIMATYNRGYCIKRAVESVLRQPFKEWELIIIDDGSSDNTEEVVKSFKDSRIRYIKLSKNSGVNVARNRGYKEAEGEWSLILDSDNELREGFLNIAKSYIDKYNFDYMKFLTKNRNSKEIMGDVFKGFLDYRDFLVDRVKGEFNTLVKTSLIREHLFFEDINGGEGITWKLIAKDVKRVLFIPEVSIVYDDSGSDRLSIKNHKRLYKIFKKDLEVLGKDYWKISKRYYFLVLAKKIYYFLMSLKEKR